MVRSIEFEHLGIRGTGKGTNNLAGFLWSAFVLAQILHNSTYDLQSYLHVDFKEK